MKGEPEIAVRYNETKRARIQSFPKYDEVRRKVKAMYNVTKEV